MLSTFFSSTNYEKLKLIKCPLDGTKTIFLAMLTLAQSRTFHSLHGAFILEVTACQTGNQEELDLFAGIPGIIINEN